jgi:predicted nucleic acid-binding protein
MTKAFFKLNDDSESFPALAFDLDVLTFVMESQMAHAVATIMNLNLLGGLIYGFLLVGIA